MQQTVDVNLALILTMFAGTTENPIYLYTVLLLLVMGAVTSQHGAGQPQSSSSCTQRTSPRVPSLRATGMETSKNSEGCK